MLIAIALIAFCTSNSYADRIAEGKTKIIRRYEADQTKVIIESKDDITAGDGKKHDIMRGKSSLANQTTCNVFRLLKACEIPVAFDKQIDHNKFLAPQCSMIALEVVVRRAAHGSFLKRYPHLHKGDVFPQLIVEFFLKTSNRQWQGTPIAKDDPFMIINNNKADLYLPDAPLHLQQPFLTLDSFPCDNQPELYDHMARIAKKTFLVLEKAWQLQGGHLVDFKVEFGIDAYGNLLLADVIDNDSWRVLKNENYIDKQFYRDGGQLDAVTKLYEQVQELTARFLVPTQQLIIWRGSEKDVVEPLLEQWKSALSWLDVKIVTISMHKEPVKGYQELQRALQEIPYSVVVAFIGRSNGAGPTLAAQCTVPVITVPVNWQQFPEDVWSSLRAPSEVPVLTVLEPHNALLAALQILAMNNPALYAQLRMNQEKRLLNALTY
jgi:phosphoribosylaminoimidazole carboxylase/phosphoribosylaminoimidazole-succinocarboxamide synthase